jgi:copper chaperone CopZ
MYRILFCCLLGLMLFAGHEVLAGNKVVKESYTVNGVCVQCKQRIEDAAYIKGVKYADWNVDDHSLTVKYDPTKTSANNILQSIARAGHDNDHFKATDEDYNRLPSCCHYRSGIKKH